MIRDPRGSNGDYFVDVLCPFTSHEQVKDDTAATSRDSSRLRRSLPCAGADERRSGAACRSSLHLLHCACGGDRTENPVGGERHGVSPPLASPTGGLTARRSPSVRAGS